MTARGQRTGFWPDNKQVRGGVVLEEVLVVPTVLKEVQGEVPGVPAILVKAPAIPAKLVVVPSVLAVV